MVHPNPFRDPAFGGPRFIATKRENPRPGYNSSIVQNFTPVGITDADVYLSWTKICLISAIGYTSVWQITIMAIVFLYYIKKLSQTAILMTHDMLSTKFISAWLLMLARSASIA